MTSPFRATVIAAGAAFWYATLRRERGRVERLAAAALESLLNAIDANDPQTGAHVRRVARAALILGDGCDLSPHDCRSIERVALFHDIGKIQEALFDITHDASALSAAERTLIATHAQRGAEVLAPLAAFYPDLGEGVLAHHERWDGTGYPRGLIGKQIPLAARIVSIADTFDAITHRRRYDAARSFDDAAAVIASERGKQFDPAITDVFLSPSVFPRICAAIGEAAILLPVGDTRSANFDARADVPDVAFRWRHVTVTPALLEHRLDKPQSATGPSPL